MAQTVLRPVGARGGTNAQHRRFFDKVTRDAAAPFDAARDGRRFMAAALEFSDYPVDLLYRLTNPAEHGAKRLKVALSCADDAGFRRDCLLPFLALLGSDALGRGTCQQPLKELVQTIYQVPGLLACITDALEADSSAATPQLSDPSPLGWLALNAAMHVPGARSDQHLQRIADALVPRGGAAREFGRQLQMVLAPSAAASDGASGAAASAAASADVVAINDLLQAAGGRHDNDAQDFRDVRVMVTSSEVLCKEPAFLPRTTDANLQLASCPEAALLDRQFRLLREDMVAPLRQAMQQLGLTQDSDGRVVVLPPGSTPLAGARSQQQQQKQQDMQAAVTRAAEATSTRHAAAPWLVSAASSMARNVFASPTLLGVCLKPRPCVMVAITLPPGHRAARMRTKKEREQYWQSYGHGLLPQGSLVCLATPGQPLAFGTVVRRDPAELAEQQPMLGLALEPGEAASSVLRCMGTGPLPNTVLIQASTNLMSTVPVLRGLQSLPTVPLADELVHHKPPQHTDYLDWAGIEQELERLANSLDPSQLAAVRQALQLRVGCIQGPPGTGKTFAGVHLCDLILKHSSARILCVCYTNHALDQFLEALLDRGISDIVRIGGRSKSQRLAPFYLRAQAPGVRRAAEGRRTYQLLSELEQVHARMEHLTWLLSSTLAPATGGSGSGGGSSSGGSGSAAGSNGAAALQAWQARKRMLQHASQQRSARHGNQQASAGMQAGSSSGSDSSDEPQPRRFSEWRDVLGPFLEAEHPDLHEQLSVPDGMARMSREYLWSRWLQGRQDKGGVQAWLDLREGAAKQDSSNWSTTGVKKQRPKLPPVLLDACRSLDRGQAVDTGAPELLQAVQEHLWALPPRLRHCLAHGWREQVRQQWAEELAELLHEHAQALQQELHDLRNGSGEQALAKARVIGCTTTGAALHKQLLMSPATAPTVVMVEEAAEILEAHVLTSLSPRTQHLIQIGDHKQLRPKVDTYELSVQAGRGHSLNVSLFERLVMAGLPHTTLEVQHRMHPDISSLIKHTYPVLQDHPSVHSRAAVKGLASRVVFVDHDQPELQASKATSGQWSSPGETKSKVNEHEVELATATVIYLLQQGYAAEQLVVLTPYLGQLMELQRSLSAVTNVVLADRDVSELRAAMLPGALAGLGSASSSIDDDGANATSGGNGRSQQAAAASRPAYAGVRVATIDNYQGEEADVVVASLVRCNAEGRVGFLREPERINVLLSRARLGMVLIGSATTLHTATNAAARVHWGVVLKQLQQRGCIHRGLPAVCQQHGRAALPMPDSAAAFRRLVPDGGCTEPCGAALPCGHVCSLRCHTFDREHTRVRCNVLVYELCAQGHLTTRACSDTTAACSTCVEIQQLQEAEARRLRQLEAEAAKARAEADKRKARLAAEVSQLRQRLDSLADKAAARQEAVKLELQKTKMEKELELQKKRIAGDLAAWEQQERQAAQEELQRLEQEAAAEAELAAQQAQQQDADKAALAKKLQAAERSLQAADAEADKALQGVENRRRQLAEETRAKQGQAEAAARQAKSQLVTVVKWRAALLQLSSDGQAGLAPLRQLLRDAAIDEAAAEAAADSLDVVLELPGLGKTLLSYAADPAADDSGSKAPQVPAAARRGLELLKSGSWVDALQSFSAQLQAMPASAAAGERQQLQALVDMCTLKLGLPQAAAAPAGGRPKRPVAAAPADDPAAPAAHAVLHLAAALRHTQQQAASSGARAGGGALSVASYRQARAAEARACGLALACLLHPAAASSRSTDPLAAEALLLLRERGQAAFSASSASPLLAAGGSKSGSASSASLRERAGSSKVLAELLQLTGMEPVKQAMLDLADQVVLDRQRGRDVNSSNFNVRFYGNPGTGKTTVARLYARLLEELGVLPQAAVEETSGAALLSGGLSSLKELLKKLDKGGVLFIDEAYQLHPAANPLGGQVMDYLLPEIENRRGKLVVVLAGYQKPMEEKIMAYNEGLPSRFPRVFKFPDYTDEELLAIFTGMLEAGKPAFSLADPKHARIACRRLGRQRDSGAAGFGNARAVRNLLEAATARQSARVLRERRLGLEPDLLQLQRDDLLGPKELDVSGSKPLQQLQGMTGLQSVKDSFSTLLGLIRTNTELEEAERPLKRVNLNRVFLGNPGTGKTTVAGIYGSILRDLGLLSKGDVLVKVPADFIGSVLGESEKKTAAILEEARGCVLVIDEAYGLHAGRKAADPYKEAVVDTIVAKVQGVPGDDRCVLLLGYAEQMETMMREGNPGLARRFQLSEAWRFEDYSKDDLLTIMRDRAAASYGWQLGWPELQAALATLERQRRQPNFRNAGAVANLLASAAGRMEARLRDLPPAERALAAPAPEDFMDDADRAAAAAAAGGDGAAGVFADLIGCESVLAKLREWQATISACQALGRDPLQSFDLCFTFVGSPGTGKTTVARRVGRLFQQLGLLASDEVVEVSAGDFVTGYVNQSAGKTRQVFEQALGRVLFVDEAYRLNPKHGGAFMSEVLDEICLILTDARFKDKQVVIFAGYEHQVEELLAVNPGLKSRFSGRLVFPDFSTGDAARLLVQQLQREYGLELAADAAEQLRGLMQQLMNAPNWSNGRDVVTWSKRIFRAYALRLAPGQGGGATSLADQPVTLQDLQASLAEFLADKQGPTSEGTPQKPEELDTARQALQSAYELPPPQPSPAIDTAPPAVEAPQQEADVAEQQVDVPGGGGGGGSFGGLDPDFLRAMQDALEARGYDLTSADIMQQLASDASLPQQLAALLAGGGSGSAAMAAERVRQWQQAIQEQLELEREMARKRQRPVWRCAVCGRYGCPVAPYIESYQDVPE